MVLDSIVGKSVYRKNIEFCKVIVWEIYHIFILDQELFFGEGGVLFQEYKTQMFIILRFVSTVLVSLFNEMSLISRYVYC